MIKSVTFVNSSHYQKDFIVFLQEVYVFGRTSSVSFCFAKSSCHFVSVLKKKIWL